MKKTLLAAACAAFAIPLVSAPAPAAMQHVPDRLDSVRLISPTAATKNHIAIVNVAGALPADAWPLVSTYAASRLQLNVWTNAIPKSVFPAAYEDGKLVGKALGEKAKVAVFIEDADTPFSYVSAPGFWCRVNVRPLKADNPSQQTLRDRYAKAILKGFVYACGSGASLDGRSASNYNTFDLAGIDKTGITISPESYFPMLEVLRIVGGDDILSPSL